ncbi:MAG TPA: hypothetical protein VG028_14730 [Terriglobia bacterium]|nr:hypothetical protein [Terriglobia bacterium]
MKPSEGLKRSRGQYKGLYEKEKEARKKVFEDVVRIDQQDKNGKVIARFPRRRKST